MSIWERKIEFIYQELDIAQEFPGEGNYRGGIKATALDSMDCISRFFASCFGRTMEYKGKVYIVGEESFRKFSIRHELSNKNAFDPAEAAENIMKQYAKLPKIAFSQMQEESAPTVKKGVETVSIQKNDLEKVFNALGIPPKKRAKLTLQFNENEKEYFIAKKAFLKALNDIEHELPQKPPKNLPYPLKKVSEEILKFLHHKTAEEAVRKKIDQLFFESGKPTPFSKPVIAPPIIKPPKSPTPVPKEQEKKLPPKEPSLKPPKKDPILPFIKTLKIATPSPSEQEKKLPISEPPQKSSIASTIEESIPTISLSTTYEELPKPIQEVFSDINEKDLAHIQGSTFVQNTGLEGSTVSRNMNYLLALLKEKIYFRNQKNMVLLLEEGFRIAQKTPTFTGNHKVYKQQIASYSKEISQRIRSLQPGEKVMIPGGWSSREGGHAMIYLIEKTADGKFAITVVNTGSGIEHHTSYQLGLKHKTNAIYRLKEIDEKKMCNPQFFESLLELNITTKQDNTPWEHGSKDIYERILPALEGKRDHRYENKKDFISEQKSGTCSWQSLIKLIRSEGEETKKYKQFIFDERQISLLAFHHKYSQEPVSDQTSRLYHRSKESFLQYALQLHKKNIIPQAELEAAKAVCQLKLNTITSEPSILSLDSFFPFPERQIAPDCLKIHSPVVSDQPINPPLTTIPPQLSNSPPETLLELNKRLDHIDGWCRKCQKNNEGHQILRIAMELIQSLQNVSIEKLTQEESASAIESAMTKLFYLHHFAMNAISMLPPDERTCPDYFALLTVLLGINLQFSRALDPSHNPFAKEKWGLYTNKEDPLFFSGGESNSDLSFFKTNQYLTIHDPALRSLLSDNIKHLTTDKDHRLFESNSKFNDIRFSDVGECSIPSLALLLKNSDFRTRILKKFPHLAWKADKGILNEVLSEIANLDNDIFPKAFQILFLQYRFTNYYKNNLHLQKWDGQSPVSNQSSSFKPFPCLFYSLLSFDFFPAGTNNKKEREIDNELAFSCQKPEAPHTIWNHYKDYHIPFQTHRFDTIFEKMGAIETKGSENIDPSICDCLWTASSNKAVTMPAVSGLSQQETHEIAYILSNKESKIPNLISYFHRYPNLFMNREFQLAFYHILFAGSALEDTVKTNPLLADKLFLFLRENADLQKGLGNTQAQIFLLSLIEELEIHILPKEKTEVQTEFDGIVSSISDEFTSGKKLKALGCMHLIASYSSQTSFTHDELIKLSTAYSYIRAFGYEKNLTQRYIEAKIHSTMKNVLLALETTPEVHLKIVQEIETKILKKKNLDWSGSYPHFSTKDDSFRFELHTFSLFEGKNIIGALPDVIHQNLDFQTLFSGKEFTISCEHPTVYSLSMAKTGKKESYRLFYQAEGKELVIQKEIHGEWYTYLPPKSIEPFLEPRCLIDNHACWALNSKDESVFMIESLDTKRFVAKVLLKGNLASPEWRKINPDQEDDNARLQDIYTQKTHFSHFFSFQPMQSILLWENKTLEFPSLGIQFTTDADKKMRYSRDNTYFLSEKQVAPKTVPLFKAYTAIENQKGVKKYLFSREPISSTNEGSLDRETKIEFANKNGRFFEIEEKNGKLTGKTVEENLYLVHLFIANKNYEQAHALLTQVLVGNPEGYKKNEKEMIEWIENQCTQSKDESPQACAILLQVAYFKLRNQPASKEEKNGWSTTISDNLTRYYSIRKHTATTSLTRQQEIELLTFMKDQKKASSVFVYRLAQLTEGKKNVPLLFNISRPIEEKKLSAEDFNLNIPDTTLQLLTHLTSKEEISFLNGDKYLTSNIRSFSDAILSEDANTRDNAAFSLSLLKIPYSVSLSKLRTMMQFFAKQSTSEMRRQLAKMPLYENKSSIEAWLNALLTHCKQISLPQESPVTSFSEQISPKTVPDREKIPREKLNFSLPLKKANSFSIETLLKKEQVILTSLPAPKQSISSHPLHNTFAPQESDSKVLQNECKRLQESLKAHENNLAAVDHYSLDTENITKITAVVKTKIEDLHKTSSKLEDQILFLANKRPSDELEALRFELQIQGNVKKELTLDDLLIFYLQNNGDALSKRNPHLHQSDVDLLSEYLTEYLIQKTEIDHLTCIRELGVSIEKDPDNQTLLSDLNIALRQKRTYDPTEKLFLLFEYYSQMRLRESQKQLINKMTEADPLTRKNLIAQLIMGSGKSKVISPLLAYLLSDGKHVPFLIVPSRLYHQNIEDTRLASGMLHQPVETISIAPGEILSIQKMNEILLKMEKVKEERSYFLISDQTAHDLLLQFKEVLREIGENGSLPEVMNRFRLLQKIVGSFDRAIIDEVDLILDCGRETHISCGNRLTLQESTKNTLSQLFTAIHHNDTLRAFFKLDKETETLFDQKTYLTTIKPLLIDTVLDSIDLPSDQRQEAKKYLGCDLSLTEVPLFIKNNNELRGHLAFSKELINKLFPLVLNNKNCNEAFGLSKETNELAAIPYIRSNAPAEGSEFGTPFETMLYTMLYFTRQGISAKHIHTLIEKYKNEALQEFRAFHTPLEKTKGYAQFQKLGIGNDLFRIREEEIEKSVEAMNKDMNKKMTFVHQFAWASIGSYSQRLSSNAMSLVELIGWFQGFTGTLGNADTFHKNLEPNPDLAVDGKTVDILYKSQSKVIPLSADIENLFTSLKGYHALIDEGAWFRGWDAIDVANKFLTLYPSFKGFVYINDVDIPSGTLGRAVILERGKKVGETAQLKLLTESSISPEERFTYYNITEGIDIKQAAKAKALTTISKTTTLRGLLQAVWRMRGLENQQKVDFALPQELEKDVGDFSLEAVFLHCTKNQAKKQEEDNLRAIKQKISNEIETMINKVLRDPAVEESVVASLCKEAKELITRRSSLDPWELFGEIEFEKKMPKVIEHYIAQSLSEFKPIYDNTALLQKIKSWEDLEKTIYSLVNYDLLPKTDFVSGNKGYGLQTQAKKEMKVEQKTKVQTKLQVNTLAEDVTLHEKTLRPSQWLLQTTLFSEQFWKIDETIWKDFEGPQAKTINDLLEDKKNQLVGYKSSLPKFSDQIKTSKRHSVVSEYLESVIFQNGTKPIGTAALLINETTGELSLCLLTPTECELLSKLLDCDKFYTEKKIESIDEKTIEDEARIQIEALKIQFKKKFFNGMRGPESLEGFLYEKKMTENDLLKAIVNENGILPKALYSYCNQSILFDRIEFEESVQKKTKEFKNLHDDTHNLSYGMIKRLFGSKRELNIALMTPESGIIKTGRKSIDEKVLESPQYIELCSQAKFYNGVYNDFTLQEQNYLKSWIKREGVEKMIIFFGNVLRARPEDLQAFEGSILQKIFDEFSIPLDAKI